MDIKDSYLHGAIGVVKSISVNADKLTYKLADQANTPVEVTLPTATKSANGLLSSTDKTKLDSLHNGSSYQNLVTVINTGSETVVYKKVTITKNDLDGYGIWIHSRNQHYLLNSGATGMSTIKNTFWELGTNINSTAVSTTRGIRVKMVATASSATVTLYIAMEAYTYFQVVSSGIIKVEDSTKDIYDGITSSTTGWVSCNPAKWSDTTYNIVSNSANGLAPKVINTNTSTIGNTYYLLASSNGSSAPSWYKLPATAFSNDDTKVTQTNTTSDGTYRVLFSSTADDTTRTEGARKSANLKFNPSTGNLTTTSLNLNGDIVINDGTNKDRYIKWQYNNTDQYGWRIGYLGDNAAHGDDNNALVLDSCQGTKGWATALKFDQNSMNAIFTKNVTANTFIGNLDGKYINALTDYETADAIGSIAATDSLNSALGKLEYKTDFIYNDIIGGENNANVIDKWSEIKDFIAEVGNSTDITDVFVTRKTALTVTGLKTFTDNIIINTTAANKTPKLTLKEHYTGSSSWISEIVSDYYGKNVCTTENFTHGLYIILGRELFNNLNILDSTKTPIARISKDKGHWFDGTLTTSEFIAKSANGKITRIYSTSLTSDSTGNALTVIKGGNFTHKLVLSDSFAGGCVYAILKGGYDQEGTLVLKSFNIDTTNNTATVKNTTTISTGASSFSGNVTAVKFITKNGTSAQFVKGDGSLDSNTYALSSSLGNYVTLNTTQTISGSKTFTSTLTTRSINPLSNNTYSLGTSDKKWASLYSTNIYSNAIYNGTTIYASNNEILHADSSYFELNKGYPDAIMWMNASEYKLKLGSKIVQFMIAANGNVGIGDVGGAPAYKLHVGGGEIMADTVHAWSGGFKKNGSSDEYVLLGGGGHKALTALFTSLTSNSTNVISITIGGTTKTITKSTLASSLGLGSNAYTSTAYLPLAGGQMNASAYISWNNGDGGNDVSDWSSITANGLRIISSTSETSKAPKRYATALHVKGRYGFLLASEGGATAKSFYIANINNKKEDGGLNWFLLLHSGNYSSYLPLLNSASTHATNESVIYAPSTAGNSGQILISSGTGAPRWGDYSVKSISKEIASASAGWYRIATSTLGISNCLGTFEILGSRSSYHTSAKIVTGTSYGNTVSLNVVDCLNWTSAALTKVRIVYHTTWSGNYAYLEVYKVALENVKISVKSVNGFGWTLIDPIVGSVPSGYSTLERNLTSNVFQTDGISAASASFNGSVTLTGTTAATSVLKFSREGANTWNYILWPGNTNKDCKLAFGYSNNSDGVYYYMTSGALYPAANNTYDLGTTNNAWKTIYGTVTNVAGVAATANAARHVWFSDSDAESKRVYDDDFKYNPYTNLLTVGSISGSAAQLTTTEIVSKKFTSLTNASWADTGYTFTNLESGTYAILVTSTNLVASGIMSVYKNIQDSVGDEIPLHVYGTAGWRPYLRTNANKLLISSNDVKAATNGRTVTIKIAKIL